MTAAFNYIIQQVPHDTFQDISQPVYQSSVFMNIIKSPKTIDSCCPWHNKLLVP